MAKKEEVQKPHDQEQKPKVDVNKGDHAEKLPTQDDIKPGVPNQEPPTAGPTARIDGDPNKPGEKL